MVVLDIKNRIDFFLRNTISWEGFSYINKCNFEKKKHFYSQVRSELQKFFSLFPWKEVLPQTIKNFSTLPTLHIADIGAKDFVLAPLFEEMFHWENKTFPHVYGIEVDPHRRYLSLGTRGAFGTMHAQSIHNGTYLKGDVMDWHQKPLHIAFLLHPFVTLSPLTYWGLPSYFFNPQGLFQHVARLLFPSSGVLFLSTPSQEEFQIAEHLMSKHHLRRIAFHYWVPTKDSLGLKPRFGGLFTFEVTSINNFS